MDAALWRLVGRALPGPVALAVWIVATVPAPLVIFEAGHRWEEHQAVATALCTVFLGASMAGYRWIIPLTGTADWSTVLLTGVSGAICGAAVGYLFGLTRVRRGRLSARRGYVIGGIAAMIGAFVAQTTAQLGAEGSTVGPGLAGYYGGVGPYLPSAGDPGILTLPTADRYAIFAMGFAPDDPDCQVTGVGLTTRSAEAVTIPPGDYGDGGDFATYAWVASFDAPAPGTFSLACRTWDEQATYVVGEVPQIRGAVGALIHWPLVTIWLLGTIPGLLIIADAIRRRGARDVSRSATAPPPPG